MNKNFLDFCRELLASGSPWFGSYPYPNRVLEGEGKTMRHIKFRSQGDPEHLAVT